MNIRRLGATFLLCIATFAIVIEIFFPAPKTSQYCTQSNCLEAARDILIGKTEDYLGQLIPPFLYAIGLGFILTIFSFLTKNPKRWGILGLEIIFAGIGYGVLLRFYVVFSLWPAASWFILSAIGVVFGYLLFTHRESKKYPPSI